MKLPMPNLTSFRGLLLGLVVLAFGQTGVRADCGDHVVLGGNEAKAQSARAHSSLSGQPSHTPTNKPCNGPTCRKQSPLAPAIPLEVSKRLIDQPIWIAYLETASCPDQTGLLFQNVDCTLSGGYPQGIFHPPRV